MYCIKCNKEANVETPIGFQCNECANKYLQEHCKNLSAILMENVSSSSELDSVVLPDPVDTDKEKQTINNICVSRLLKKGARALAKKLYG